MSGCTELFPLPRTDNEYTLVKAPIIYREGYTKAMQQIRDSAQQHFANNRVYICCIGNKQPICIPIINPENKCREQRITDICICIMAKGPVQGGVIASESPDKALENAIKKFEKSVCKLKFPGSFGVIESSEKKLAVSNVTSRLVNQQLELPLSQTCREKPKEIDNYNGCFTGLIPGGNFVLNSRLALLVDAQNPDQKNFQRFLERFSASLDSYFAQLGVRRAHAGLSLDVFSRLLVAWQDSFTAVVVEETPDANRASTESGAKPLKKKEPKDRE